jgi:hypothetical protein
MTEESTRPTAEAVNAARRAVREQYGQTQGELLRAAQRRKLDALFRGRLFDIVRTIDLPPGKVFITCMGAKAYHGFVLRARDNGEEIALGFRLLQQVQREYLAVARMPPRLRWRRKYGERHL